jgi:hypothetical protein
MGFNGISMQFYWKFNGMLLGFIGGYWDLWLLTSDCKLTIVGL